MKFALTKEDGKKPGAYLIKNLVSGKVYVGCTTTYLYKRYREHFISLSKGIHYSKKMQKAWNEGKPEDFEFHLLEHCTKNKAVKTEQFWLDHYKPYLPENGYNSCWRSDSSFGFKHTEESLILIGQRSKERGPHINTIKALKKANTGRKPSKKQIEALLKRASKAVVQLTLDGVFVKEWDSGALAGRTLGVNGNNIQACTRGVCKSVGGFLWVKKSEYNPSIKYEYKPIINGLKVKDANSF